MKDVQNISNAKTEGLNNTHSYVHTDEIMKKLLQNELKLNGSQVESWIANFREGEKRKYSENKYVLTLNAHTAKENNVYVLVYSIGFIYCKLGNFHR